jgi:hypothetical protein
MTVGRWSGACLVLAGLLTLPAVTHPDILEIGLAEASLTAWWTLVHAVGLAVVVLFLAGVAGLALLHRGRWGTLGTIAVPVTVVGLVATAVLSGIEAFVFPAVALAEPALLDFDGPIAGAPGFWILGGLAVLWLLGSALLGVAVARAGVLPRAPALLLAAGALSFAAFEGPFVPVLGQLAVVVFAAGQVWLGAALLGAARSTVELPSTGR